jgi:hypothetical protein
MTTPPESLFERIKYILLVAPHAFIGDADKPLKQICDEQEQLLKSAENKIRAYVRVRPATTPSDLAVVADIGFPHTVERLREVEQENQTLRLCVHDLTDGITGTLQQDGVEALEKRAREVEVELDAYKSAIAMHNAACESVCGDRSRCGYKPYGRDCPNCVKEWMIDITTPQPERKPCD